MSESATIERDPEQRLRAKSAAELLGIGLSTWWAWVKAGKAPAPLYINDRQPRLAGPGGIVAWRH